VNLENRIATLERRAAAASPSSTAAAQALALIARYEAGERSATLNRDARELNASWNRLAGADASRSARLTPESTPGRRIVSEAKE
jgi:hypothetical protein